MSMSCWLDGSGLRLRRRPQDFGTLATQNYISKCSQMHPEQGSYAAQKSPEHVPKTSRTRPERVRRVRGDVRRVRPRTRDRIVGSRSPRSARASSAVSAAARRHHNHRSFVASGSVAVLAAARRGADGGAARVAGGALVPDGAAAQARADARREARAGGGDGPHPETGRGLVRQREGEVVEAADEAPARADGRERVLEVCVVLSYSTS